MSQRVGTLLAVAVVLFGTAAEMTIFALTGLEPGEMGGAPPGVEVFPAIVGFGFVGAFLLHRRPSHRVGWILAAVGVVSAFGAGATVVADHLVARGGSVQFPVTLELVGRLASEFTIVLAIVLLPVLFPSGEVPSPRWRWLPRIAVATGLASQASLFFMPDEVTLAGREFANPYAIESLGGPLELLGGLFFVGMLLLTFPAVAALVVRFRRATGLERQQLRWFVFAMLVLVGAIVLLLLWAGAWNLGLLPNPSELTFDIVVTTALTTVPLAIGAAVLRYRLYDIDRVLSRTVSYTLLTVLLAGVYASLVLTGQAVVGARADVPDVVIAGATLAVAALFLPLSHRVQRSVDRRFARHRYDGAVLASGFAARLRDTVRFEQVSDELGVVVHGALAPTTASLWVSHARLGEGTAT